MKQMTKQDLDNLSKLFREKITSLMKDSEAPIKEYGAKALIILVAETARSIGENISIAVTAGALTLDEGELLTSVHIEAGYQRHQEFVRQRNAQKALKQ